MLAGIADKEIQYPAYTGFHYSNLGIYIIGQAFQRIVGEPYTRYMQGTCSSPLGMTNTGWEYTEAMKPHRAIGYRRPAGRHAPDRALFVPGDFGVSAGGIQSSVRDMAKFLSLQFCDGPAGGAQILGGTSLREMRASLVPAPNWMWGYGLGWEVEQYPGHNGICHSGGTLGFASKVRAVPDLKLGFVVLINQDTDSDELSRKPVEVLSLPSRSWRKDGTAGGASAPADAARYTGHYAGQFGCRHLASGRRLVLITTKADGTKGAPWTLERRADSTLLIRSGSKELNGQFIAFRPGDSSRSGQHRTPGHQVPTDRGRPALKSSRPRRILEPAKDSFQYN